MKAIPRITRLAAAWLAAALVSALLISLSTSQFVLWSLQNVGAEITWSNRLFMSVADLRILETLIPVMLACFLVGFLVASLCHRLLGMSTLFWNSLAGASSIVVTLLLMSWLMNLMPIAGARTTLGMIAVALCGAFGGLVYDRLRNSLISTRNSND